jgi:hypothetical protein
MELEQGQAAFPDGAQDKVSGRIYENSCAHDEGGHLAGNFGRLLEREVTRAFLIEVEAQSVRARGDRGFRVGEIGNAADFYLCAHGQFLVFGPWDSRNLTLFHFETRRRSFNVAQNAADHLF